jgi:hypothetical protein
MGQLSPQHDTSSYCGLKRQSLYTKSRCKYTERVVTNSWQEVVLQLETPQKTSMLQNATKIFSSVQPKKWTKDVYNISTGKPARRHNLRDRQEGHIKVYLKQLRCQTANWIKTDLRELTCETVKWIQLTQDWVQWWIFVSKAMNFWVS